MARGLNLAQDTHVVPVLAPASITGGANGQVFNLKNAAKCSIVIYWGALAAAPGTVTLSACSDLAGDNAQAIGFDRYTQAASGAGNDVLGVRTPVTSAGYTPSDVANTIDVLEVQADQLPMGLPYLKLSLADGSNADFASAVAILSGLRFAGESNQSATT